MGSRTDNAILSMNHRRQMLQQRGERIIRLNDELISRTLRAYGGEYKRKGNRKFLMFNGKVYRNFEISLIRGKYLIIKTPDGRYLLEVVNR